MSNDFRRSLDHIRSIPVTEAPKGHLFERLVQAYLREDPLYRERFSHVWLWPEWVRRFNEDESRRAAQDPESKPPMWFDLDDTGIDLVARERDGGWCAIQCKCYAPGTRIGKRHLDSFVSASDRDPFTSRIVVDAGDSWASSALKTLRELTPGCTVLRFGDLASRPFDWPDLASWDYPEDLRHVGEPFELRAILAQVAWAAVRTKQSYYRGLYYRMKNRGGPKKATVAVQPAILVAIWHMIFSGRCRFASLIGPIAHSLT